MSKNYIYIILCLVFAALVFFWCLKLFGNIGVALLAANFPVLLCFRFSINNFDRYLGIEEMHNYWDTSASTNIQLLLPSDAILEPTSNSRILTSTYESIINASGLEKMQGTLFVLSDTKSIMTNAKNNIVGAIIINVFSIFLVALTTVTNKDTVGIVIDPQTITAIALTLLQYLSYMMPLYVLYQRNQSHLDKINGP